MILVSPENFFANKPINPAEEKHFLLNDINNKKLCDQHKELLGCLKKHKINYKLLNARKDLPEQTFVRDTSFIIDDKIFICKMRELVRKKETEIVKEYFKTDKYKNYKAL